MPVPVRIWKRLNILLDLEQRS